MTKQQARLRVRLYARLSKDDGDADKESNSITNQLQMLRYYSKEKGFEIIDEYVDDGYSGTTFNRPDLNRMIEDAMEDTQPSGIMVKDMSRFGRNNAMFMYYVEEIFPNNDILFIALNDDVDTRYEDNEMMPFKSIMNEYYARDTSKKIRSVKKTTALSGGFCGSFAPYGYRVDPNNKRKLLIDPETAPIVKRIFEMSKQGNSVHQIARTLCEEKILIPRAYRAMKNGTLETSTGFRFPTDWVGKNVKMILENQVYLGHMVSHKTQTKSFKNRKLVAVPKEDWIVVKNTHEAIIDEETFELAQKRIATRQRPTKVDEIDLFSGLLFCGDCGYKMYAVRGAGTLERKHAYTCGNYRNRARNDMLCTTHYIRKSVLKELVLADLQRVTSYVKEHEQEFIETANECSAKAVQKTLTQQRKELDKAQNRINELNILFRKLYEDNALGKLSDEQFAFLTSGYDEEIKTLTRRIAELSQEIDNATERSADVKRFVALVRRYTAIEELTYENVHEFIDRILIHELDKETNTRKIEIFYSFVGRVDTGDKPTESISYFRQIGADVKSYAI